MSGFHSFRTAVCDEWTVSGDSEYEVRRNLMYTHTHTHIHIHVSGYHAASLDFIRSALPSVTSGPSRASQSTR